jgi:hypothetical protein
MLPVVLVIVALSTFMAVGRWYLVRGKIRTLERLKRESDAEIERRLRLILDTCNGSIVEGPALQTPHGKLALIASKAPESYLIDTAKFTAPVRGERQLAVVRVEDVRKVMAKGLKAVIPQDEEIAQSYAVLGSDTSYGRPFTKPGFIDRLRRLDEAVKGRCRLMVVRGSATVLLTRGLASPEELKAFYDGCVEIVSAVKQP